MYICNPVTFQSNQGASFNSCNGPILIFTFQCQMPRYQTKVKEVVCFVVKIVFVVVYFCSSM
jgi:hypothetical protein